MANTTFFDLHVEEMRVAADADFLGVSPRCVEP